MEISYRRVIKEAGGRCAAILLVMGISAQFFSLGITFILQMFTNAAGRELNISQGMMMFLQGYLPCILADFLAIGVGFIILKPNFADGVFSKAQGETEFKTLGAFAALGAGNIGAMVFSVMLLLFGAAGASLQIPAMSDPQDNLIASILNIGYACLLGPILEEIIFRGLLLKHMEKFGAMTAIIVSSVMFGMMHLNPAQMPGACLIGLILGYLTVKTHSLYPAIIAHILNNTIRTLPTIFLDITSPLMVIWSYLLIIAGGIVLIIFLLKYGRGFTNILKFEDVSLAKVGNKITWISTSWFSLAYIAFFLWAMAKFFDNFVK